MKGKEVKEFRERIKLSVDDFAFILRIKPSKLKQLEQEDKKFNSRLKAAIVNIWGGII